MYQNFIIPYLYEVQHVSGDTPTIIRSLKLHCQLQVFHTWKVVGRVVGGRCQAHGNIPQDSISFTFTAAGLPTSRVTPNGLRCQEFNTGVLDRTISPKYDSLVTRLYNAGNKGTIPRVPSVVRGWIYYTTDIT